MDVPDARRAAAVRLLETRGRKSATHAAAEAEVEAIALAAELQVAERELGDALADAENLRRELQLRKERMDGSEDELETMREEMMALAERRGRRPRDIGMLYPSFPPSFNHHIASLDCRLS